MKETIIIYDSKYGYTQQYAQWLAEELNADLCEIKRMNINVIKDYSTLIFGSSIYAGRSKAALTILKHYKNIERKRVVLFTCGLSDVGKESNIATINKGLDRILTNEIRSRIQIFHTRGGIDYSRLSFVHKAMMKMVFSHLSKKPENELSDENRDLLATYGQVVDYKDKKMLEPIIQYCRDNQPKLF
jgi:menaquinone-dependent protoporphyrinogen IX oxidase